MKVWAKWKDLKGKKHEKHRKNWTGAIFLILKQENLFQRRGIYRYNVKIKYQVVHDPTF